MEKARGKLILQRSHLVISTNKEKLSDDIDSDVGFVDGTNVVRIRSCDLKEAWGALMKSGKVTLRCYGLFSELTHPNKQVCGCEEVGNALSR